MRKYAGIVMVILVLVATSRWIAAQDFQGNPDKGESIYKARRQRAGRGGSDRAAERLPYASIARAK